MELTTPRSHFATSWAAQRNHDPVPKGHAPDLMQSCGVEPSTFSVEVHKAMMLRAESCEGRLALPGIPEIRTAGFSSEESETSSAFLYVGKRRGLNVETSDGT